MGRFDVCNRACLKDYAGRTIKDRAVVTRCGNAPQLSLGEPQREASQCDNEVELAAMAQLLGERAALVLGALGA